MKVNEITHDNYSIFVDMDGVLVSFDEFAEKHLGLKASDWARDPNIKRLFWKKVKEWGAAGHPFFSAMKPMPDAVVLWNYVKKNNPTILSATGFITRAAEEKREWLRKFLGPSVADAAILVLSAKDKAKYATPTSILIDDRSVAIDPWVAAGGIGILHTSAQNTILRLQELGL